CAIGTLSLFDSTGYRTACAAEVQLDAPLPWLPAATARQVSRSDLFALIAAREALVSAGWLQPEAPDAMGRMAEDAVPGIGIVLGATTGGMFGCEEYYHRTLLELPQGRHATMLTLPVSSSVDWLASVFGCLGPRL